MNALVDLIKRIGIFMVAAQAVIHFAPGQKYEKYLKLIVGIMILLQLLSPIYSLSMGAETGWEEQLANMERELAETMPKEITGEISDIGINAAGEKVIAELEEEIKSKLNSSIIGENYKVTGVRVRMRISDAVEENGAQRYALEKIRVIVRMGAGAGLKKTDVTENAAGMDTENNADKTVITAGTEITEETAITAGTKETAETAGTKETAEPIEIEEIQIPRITAGGNRLEKEAQNNLSENIKQETENRLREKFCGILGMGEEYVEVSIYGTVEECGE